MTKILVVDDSAIDRRLAGSMLETTDGTTVRYAADGREAIAVVTAEAPDLVVTDLQMPGLNGLDLVDALHALNSAIPVVLMTAHGSEDIAAAALRHGAASYVPKRELSAGLARTVARLIELSRAASPPERVMSCLETTECRLVLGNDLELVAPVVTYLRAELARLSSPNPTVSMQVGVALDEAISNAIHHGNLEVSSRLREESIEKYLGQIDERKRVPPYCDRRTRVATRIARDHAEFVVTDDGVGFDVRTLPDPRDPENLERCSGRGVMLVRMFMDEVHYNEKGNEITMVKLLP
jgi:CheY-like chemotaxis protein/anti-sigma regulatory factor (Ser/Thr protein kinase)